MEPAKEWCGLENCSECLAMGYIERTGQADLNPYEDAPVNDPVNHPAHYTRGRIEVLDFIEDQKLGYHLGQVVKYVCRAGKKDPAKYVEDLSKAEFYLKRAIANAT